MFAMTTVPTLFPGGGGDRDDGSIDNESLVVAGRDDLPVVIMGDIPSKPEPWGHSTRQQEPQHPSLLLYEIFS